MIPPHELTRIARLRRYVATFARGGDWQTASQALGELARADREGGRLASALRHARNAAALAHADGDVRGRACALLRVATIEMECGDRGAAREAAELARSGARELPAAEGASIAGCAALLAGTAARLDGDPAASRELLDEARDTLVDAGEPEGAGLALAELGLLDLSDGDPERAAVCFRYAMAFHRAAASDEGAARAAAAAARAFDAAGFADHAAEWSEQALAAADLAGDARLAAWLAFERADQLARAAPDRAVAAAHAAAGRLARLPERDAATEALFVRSRILLGSLLHADEAARHLEAAFDLALAARDHAALADTLDATVGGLIAGRLPATGWARVKRFEDELAAAGLHDLATLAATAFDELR